MNTPMIPVSWGELIDKITILEIKSELIPDDQARKNISLELGLLLEIGSRLLTANEKIVLFREELSKVNRSLWRVEDEIRRHETEQDFDAEFIELARSVYRLNDQRAGLKKSIDIEVGSELTEEKSYYKS